MQTMVQVTDDLLASLDEAAASRGVSRSAIICDLVTDGLKRADADAIGERIADGYRRIPQASADAWGDQAALTDGAAEEVLRRLDAEERAAGHAPC